GRGGAGQRQDGRCQPGLGGGGRVRRGIPVWSGRALVATVFRRFAAGGAGGRDPGYFRVADAALRDRAVANDASIDGGMAFGRTVGRGLYRTGLRDLLPAGTAHRREPSGHGDLPGAVVRGGLGVVAAG